MFNDIYSLPMRILVSITVCVNECISNVLYLYIAYLYMHACHLALTY